MKQDFYEAVKKRRSYYGISKDEVVTRERITEIVNYAVTNAPSAFNSQSGRVILAFGEEHDKLWNFTKDTLRKLVPPNMFPDTEAKLNAFQSGYGTVLFFEEQETVKALQSKFALYKDNFPIWSLESSGMLQYIIWTSLEIEGLGASLQHYNPIIDEQVKKQFNVPESWKLLAQMPFGKPIAPPQDKTFIALEERVKIF